LHIFLGHDADGDGLECFGEVVVHQLTEENHLPEDGAWREDRGGQRASVGRDAENAHPSSLEDEQRLHGLRGGVEELTGGKLARRCGGRYGLHFRGGQVDEDVHLGHAPQIGIATLSLHVDQLLTAARSPRPGVMVEAVHQTVRRTVLLRLSTQRNADPLGITVVRHHRLLSCGRGDGLSYFQTACVFMALLLSACVAGQGQRRSLWFALP
jgi:hypothetical protein